MSVHREQAPGYQLSSSLQGQLRRGIGVFILFLLYFLSATVLSAQSIRGTVIDDETKAGIVDAIVELVDARDTSRIGAPQRTRDEGRFVFYADKAGTYRIKATKIGYSLALSEPLTLDDAQVAMLSLSLSPAAVRQSTITVVGQRALSNSELMSTVGFDLRRVRQIGQYVTPEELLSYGQLPLTDVIRDNSGRLFLDFARDRVFLSDVLVMRSGVNYCLPEVRLDGSVLPNASGGVVTRLTGYAARDIYGVEVYRSSRLPSPRLAGEIGTAAPGCGAVAIWTRGQERQVRPLMWTAFSGKGFGG